MNSENENNKGWDSLKSKNSHILLEHSETWLDGILPFIGPGSFAFVAPTCKELYRLYKVYCNKIQENDSNKFSQRYPTYYSTAFFNRRTIAYWDCFQCLEAAKKTPKACLVIRFVIRHGGREALEWCLENNYPYGYTDFEDAAMTGKLDLMQLLHDHYDRNGISDQCSAETCPWNEWTMYQAARHGHCHIISFAYIRGCPMDSRVVRAAASCGNVEILKFTKGILPWDVSTTYNAALSGNVKCMAYLRTEKCPWSSISSLGAAESGSIEMMKFVKEHDCPWHELTLEKAAEHGGMEMVKYCHENGCPWSMNTTEKAAQHGDLKMLKYCHENSCPWGDKTTEWAAEHGGLEMVQYCHENGCPWGNKTSEKAANHGGVEMVEYCHKQGPSGSSAGSTSRSASTAAGSRK